MMAARAFEIFLQLAQAILVVFSALDDFADNWGSCDNAGRCPRCATLFLGKIFAFLGLVCDSENKVYHASQVALRGFFVDMIV